jgi:uncharacterized membrane protein
MGLIKGIIGIFQLIYNEAEKEMLDETPWIQALDELNEKLDKGEITEEQYEIEEEEILQNLREIKRYKKENEIEEE